MTTKPVSSSTALKTRPTGSGKRATLRTPGSHVLYLMGSEFETVE